MIEILGGRKNVFGLLIITLATVMLCLGKIDGTIWAGLLTADFIVFAESNVRSKKYEKK